PQNPNQNPEDGALFSCYRLCQCGGNTKSANVTARRYERDIEQRRQHHSQNGASEIDAPLIDAHNAPPASPTFQRGWRGFESAAGMCQLNFLSPDCGGNVS